MSIKKTLIAVLAVALVCVASVAGTLAYLKDSTSIQNTFMAAGEGKMADDFKIIEHDVETDEKGGYVTGTGTGDSGNTYKILPGTTVPKDATVVVSGKTEVQAYLYIEVCEDLTEDVYDYDLADCWKELVGVTGKNGGQIYVYSDEEGAVIVTEDVNQPIIKDGVVTINNVDTKDVENDTLTFYAYLAQASVGSATEAFNACFAPATSTSSSN